MSLDALRGFDMFWIIGADDLVIALNKMTHPGGHATGGILSFIATQQDHVAWAGFHFEDLIFPLFVFMAGISIVFSLGKTIRQEGRAVAVKRVCRRSAVLFLLGLFYYGGLSNHWSEMRVMGVLNRIALCYFFAGLIFCFFNLRGMITIAVALLVGYWGLLTFVPIRNVQLQTSALQALAAKRNVEMDPHDLFYSTTERVTGHYEPGLNLTNHLDFEYLPGKLYDRYFDPEGLLSTIPAVVSCLLGVFAGLFLLNPSYNDEQKVILPARRRDDGDGGRVLPGARNFRSSRKFGLRHLSWWRAVTARFCWACSIGSWMCANGRTGASRSSGWE